MNVHEYQAKQLLSKYGIEVPVGDVVYTPEEGLDLAQKMQSNLWAVKAQIHAGGRGKAGGVKLARSLDEVKEHVAHLLGKVLVTHQTKPEGQTVRRVLVEEGCCIDKEYYIGAVVDRATDCIVLMGSEEGGMDIEEVAANTPEKIFKEIVDPAVGIMPFQARRLAYNINMPQDKVSRAAKFITSLYTAFVENDCSLAEINPLITTTDGRVMALDAKLNFDDNALYRRPHIKELRDLDEEDPKESEAQKYDLNYIALDGNIGCMVNGAGLAMATMDIIKHYDGEPANFLDVGGGATAQRVTEAFKIILSDDKVKGIYVNIFGGIMKCDIIANGIVTAAQQVKLSVPLVVRLEGTNSQLGKSILKQSGLDIFSAESMADGAQQIVKLVGSNPDSQQ